MRPLGGGSSRWCRKPATENSKALWEAAVSHCSHALSVLPSLWDLVLGETVS